MEHYDQFVESFFYHFPSSCQLSVFNGDKLICVSHFDMTDFALSAVYCYFDDTYARNSLGSFAIYKEIELGLQNSMQYLYLGYYIRENRHMSYKANYRPNQICIRKGRWVDYRDKDNNLVYDGPEEPQFCPQTRLIERLIDPPVRGGKAGERY
jgi:arginine-tRNA-protein transferase